MKKQKILALVLAVSMVAVLFAACANNPDGEAYRPPTGEGNTNVDDGYPKADYNKEDFTFLVIKHSDTIKDYYGGPYIDADTYTGGAINDAVYERNIAVEEKYNVNIKENPVVNGDPAEVLQTKYMAGEFDFDVIYGWGYKMGQCITENYFADFKSLQNVDLTKDYWSPSAMDDLTIDDRLYLCINDISMNKLDWAGFFFFNKQLMEDYNIEGVLGGNIYDLVREGKWTLDVFLNVITSISNDLDGDGNYTKNDVFGFLDGGGTGTWASHASGEMNTIKNDDGTYTLNLFNSKILGIAEKVNNVYSNNRYVKNFDEIWEGADMSAYNDAWEYARSFFATDHVLFTTGSAYLTDEFRNMESEYGIVPNPKYDENQAEYVSIVSELASIFAIPSTYRTDMSTSGPERTGTILEYMAYKSNEILLPKYYDEVLNNQRLDDASDKEMMSLIRECVRYDFTDMIGLTSFGEVKAAIYEKPSSANSTYTRQEKKLARQLSDYYAKVVQMNTASEG